MMEEDEMACICDGDHPLLECITLDVAAAETGLQKKPGDPKFTEPMPREELKKRLNQARPWEKHGYIRYDEKPKASCRSEAIDIATLLKN
jgi:hypothetical protein